MKSQYILTFLILIFVSIVYYISNLQNYYFYVSDIDKYLIEDFRIKLFLNNETLVNLTYSNLCFEYKRYCYYNGSHIILVNNDKTIIVPVKS